MSNPAAPRPKVFQIGFNRCGTRAIARLFRASGYRAAHWDKGRLAVDLRAALLAGQKPFANRADVTLFSDIEYTGYEDGQVIEGFREFAALDAAFPDARFLLNTRDRDDWLFSRLRHRGGRYARFHAARFGLSDPRDLCDRWAAEWDAHLASVRAHFSARPGKLIEFAIDRDPPDALAAALAPQIELSPEAWGSAGSANAA